MVDGWRRQEQDRGAGNDRSTDVRVRPRELGQRGQDGRGEAVLWE